MSKYKASRPPNQTKQFRVSRQHLPLHCPTDDMLLWCSHPRVFLPIEEKGEAACPYCGTKFLLKNS